MLEASPPQLGAPAGRCRTHLRPHGREASLSLRVSMDSGDKRPSLGNRLVPGHDRHPSTRAVAAIRASRSEQIGHMQPGASLRHNGVDGKYPALEFGEDESVEPRPQHGPLPFVPPLDLQNADIQLENLIAERKRLSASTLSAQRRHEIGLPGSNLRSSETTMVSRMNIRTNRRDECRELRGADRIRSPQARHGERVGDFRMPPPPILLKLRGQGRLAPMVMKTGPSDAASSPGSCPG